ncbi:MAG TPA: tetratricopeptide repeat protein [Pyrinomonadaceae bacterium]|nr:tetratricopeptide repeat protein [Pyrinomonadaceae bacterium]
MPHNLAYEFGPYRLDLNKRVLMRVGETILLAPKALEILIVLVLRAGELVEKDELLRAVWPDTFVEESNLSQNIFTLRRALGDERVGARYIETVARRGYRFIARVRPVGADDNGSETLAASERPVIAVLPFLNTSGDHELEYLAEGITDNIINNLSRVSRLRVMSRSAVFRYHTKEADPQKAGRQLGADTVLVGKINARAAAVTINVELVDVSTGWQLWGESFDSQSRDILQIQDAITRQLLATLKLNLTGAEEKSITARYTESAQAYQSYLEGRYHWSRYTRKGIEKAIKHFRRAIEVDPNYALAYAGIIDCYLRLATNYLPPEDDTPRWQRDALHPPGSHVEADQRIKLRFEWDWKGAERELRRANELKTVYPSAHQWYVAYGASKQLYKESLSGVRSNQPRVEPDAKLALQIPSIQLTPTEEVQILCSVARDQIAIGNFEAAKLVLRRWSESGKWPKLDALNPYTAADLLFTLGTLLGAIAGTKKLVHGHRRAEAFLNGAISLFEQLGIKTRSVETRAELARCYYRQGQFDIARETVSDCYSELPEDEVELKVFCLNIWGQIESTSGRLRNSLVKLQEASSLEEAGHFITTLNHQLLATTLKELAISEGNESYFHEAKVHFLRALYESEVLGHHRNVAVAENNLGFLLLSLGSFEESEKHLQRSRRLFEFFSYSIQAAQVHDTLARLYIETKQYELAQEVIAKAIETLEFTDGEALLAEALTTAGVVAAKQHRYTDANKSFEAAYKVAERCGDNEGAGRALLTMFEEMGTRLGQFEKTQISEKLKKLFAMTQQTTLLARVEKCIAEIDGNP